MVSKKKNKTILRKSNPIIWLVLLLISSLSVSALTNITFYNNITTSVQIYPTCLYKSSEYNSSTGYNDIPITWTDDTLNCTLTYYNDIDYSFNSAFYPFPYETVTTSSGSWTNPENSFDTDNSTYASHISATGTVSLNLGQTFTNQSVNTIYYKLYFINSRGGCDQNVDIYLQTYDGSTWSLAKDIYDYHACGDPTSTITGSYTNNQNISGYRLVYTMSGAGSVDNVRAYQYYLYSDGNDIPQTTETLYMQPYALILHFEQSESPYQVNGTVGDIKNNTLYSFTNTSAILVQRDLSLGKISAAFNYEGGTSNHSQYYEYINDYTTVEDTLEVLDNSIDNVLIFFKVQTYENSPIENAKIKLVSGTPSFPSTTTYNTIGQRLTDDNGETFFYLDENSQAGGSVTLDGYESKIISGIYASDGQYTQDNPYIIYLEPEGQYSENNVFLNINPNFRNRSNDITFTVVAPDYNSIWYSTDYKSTLQEAPVDNFGRYFITLDSNDEFNASGNDNIQVNIYTSKTGWPIPILWKSITLTYDQFSDNEYFETSEYTTAKPIIIFIGFILFAGILSILTSHANLGVFAFFVSTILMAQLNSIFYYLVFLTGIAVATYFYKKYGVKTE